MDVGCHEEIYRETFLETFNLFLSTNRSLTTMICKLCINRLNDATEFKAMVLESERQLLSKAEGNSSVEFENDLLKKEQDDDLNNSEDEMDTLDASGDKATVHSSGTHTDIEMVKEEEIKEEEVKHEDDDDDQLYRDVGEEDDDETNNSYTCTTGSEETSAVTARSHEAKNTALRKACEGTDVDSPTPCEGADKHISSKNKHTGTKSIGNGENNTNTKKKTVN
ncbi:hypothetical protein O0L34_g10770 [Tuta absoluta]|nr:hypothetical protein O0L34_g10770 [Tuta absoluta]